MLKVVRISAIWCAGCLVMKPRWDKIFSNYPIEIIDYDYDFDRDKLKEFNVGKIIPVLIFYKDNIEVERVIGEKSINELEKIINNL